MTEFQLNLTGGCICLLMIWGFAFWALRPFMTNRKAMLVSSAIVFSSLLFSFGLALVNYRAAQ